MFFRIVTWFIIIAFLYRVMARYVMPIFRITRITGDRLRQMQDQLHSQQKDNSQVKPRAAKEGDYIDYEEVK